MNFTLIVIVWSAMALLVLMIAVYRKVVARQEDSILHLHSNEGSLVQHQAEVAHRLELIDRFGKSATIAVSLLGLAIAAVYFYDSWVKGGQLPQ